MSTSDWMQQNGADSSMVVNAIESNHFTLVVKGAHQAATMHLDRKGMNDLQEALAKALAERGTRTMKTLDAHFVATMLEILGETEAVLDKAARAHVLDLPLPECAGRIRFIRNEILRLSVTDVAIESVAP